MKKIGVIILVVCIVFLTIGCKSTGENIYNSAMRNNPREKRISQDPLSEKQKEISILAFGFMGSSDYHEIAKEFMALNKGIAVKIDAPEMPVAQFNLYLATRLMSDTCPDIVDIWYPIEKYGNSGLLLDIYSLMEADNSFKKDRYYTNLFEACEFNGGLYGVPVSPSVQVYFFNKKIVDRTGLTFSENATIGYEKVLETYKYALEKSIVNPEKVDLQLNSRLAKSHFLELDISNYMDWNTRRSFFNSKEFIDFLELTNSIPTKGNESDELTYSGGSLSVLDSTEDYFIALQQIYGSSQMELWDYSSDSVIGPIRITGSKGTEAVQANILSLTSTCVDKDLAWSFMKYCMNGGNQKRLNAWIPINKEIFKTNCMENGNEAAFKQTDSVLKNAKKIYPVAKDPFLMMDSTKTILSSFYDSETVTAEECAKQLQEKAEIMMRE